MNGLNDANTRVGNGFRSSGDSGHHAFSRVHGAARLVLATLPLLLPLAGASVTGVLGLLGALTAALVTVGLGAAAFAAVAVPAFMRVKDAVAAGQAEIDKLPNGLRQAATAMQGLNSAWAELQKQTDRRVGLAMAEWFNAATTAVNTLHPLIDATADAFGTIGRMVNEYFGSPHWKNFVALISENMTPMMVRLFEVVAYGTRAVFNLTEAFMPMATWLLGSMSQGMKDFAHWTSTLAGDPRFHAWVETAKEALRRMWDFLAATVNFLFQFSYAMAPLGSAIFNVLAIIFAGLSKMPPEWLNGIALGLSAIFAALLFGASGPIALAIGAIVGVAVAFGTLYAESEKIRSAIDGVVGLIKQSFLPIWENVRQNFEEKILPAFNNLVTIFNLWVMPVLRELGVVVLQKIVPALASLVDTVTGRLIPAFLEWFTSAQPMIAFWTEFFGKTLVHIFEGAVRIVEGAVLVITGIFQTFTGVLTGDWDKMGQGLQTITEGFWTAIAGIFGLSLDDLKAIYNEWDANITAAWNNFWDGLGTKFSTWKTEISNSWVDYWGGFRTEQSGSQIYVNGQWNDFWDRLDQTYRDWDGKLTSGWTNFWGTFKKTADDVEAQIWGAWNKFWSDLGTRFSTWWQGIVREWNGFWGEFGRIVSVAVTQVGNEFRRIGNMFRDPIQWVIDVVLNDGVLKAWNTVMGWIGAPGLSVGRIPALPRFASGGKVEGGVPNRDSVTALLMPGEYVLSKRAIENMGGLSRVDQMHRAARTGSLSGTGQGRSDGLARQHLMRAVPADDLSARRFAFGGVQPHVAAAGMEVNRLFGPFAGGIGGVGQRANASDHPSGHALDFMTMSNKAQGDKTANHLLANAKRLLVKYLIWQQAINSGSGWRGMENRGSATANHFDHVHASFLRSGAGGADFSGEGSMAPAPVSWWSLLASQVTALFKGLIPKAIPGFGGPMGESALQIPIKLVDLALSTLTKKLEGMMTDAVANVAGSVVETGLGIGKAVGVFDNGGYLDPKHPLNGTGKPEPVLTNPQWHALMSGESADDVVNRLDMAIEVLERIAAKPVATMPSNNNSPDDARRALLALRR